MIHMNEVRNLLVRKKTTWMAFIYTNKRGAYGKVPDSVGRTMTNCSFRVWLSTIRSCDWWYLLGHVTCTLDFVQPLDFSGMCSLTSWTIKFQTETRSSEWYEGQVQIIVVCSLLHGMCSGELTGYHQSVQPRLRDLRHRIVKKASSVLINRLYSNTQPFIWTHAHTNTSIRGNGIW